MPDIYRALADPTRRTLLDELCKREGQTLFELCGRLIMAHDISSSRQAISQHLAVLEEVGLVRTERRGRSKLVLLNVPLGQAFPPRLALLIAGDSHARSLGCVCRIGCD